MVTRIYTYYGTWNINEKVKKGVHLFMLDEHIRKTIAIEKENFTKDIQALIEPIKKQNDRIIERLNEQKNYLDCIVGLNKLVKPRFDNKKPKKVETEDEEEDTEELGYFK